MLAGVTIPKLTSPKNPHPGYLLNSVGYVEWHAEDLNQQLLKDRLVAHFWLMCKKSTEEASWGKHSSWFKVPAGNTVREKETGDRSSRPKFCSKGSVGPVSPPNTLFAIIKRAKEIYVFSACLPEKQKANTDNRNQKNTDFRGDNTIHSNLSRPTKKDSGIGIARPGTIKLLWLLC